MNTGCRFVYVFDSVYNDGEVLQTAQMKSNYGDRIGCGVKQSTSDDKQIVVYFEKNGSQVIANCSSWF